MDHVSFCIILMTIQLILTVHPLTDINIAIAVPWINSSWDAGPRFAGGATIAIETINKDPSLLPGYHVSFDWTDSHCSEKHTVQGLLNLHAKTKMNAIIGPACSDGCKIAAMLAHSWNIPIVSYGCAADFLSNNEEYPNFARTVGVYAKSGHLFVKLMHRLKWDRIAILTPTSGIWSSIMTGVRLSIEGAGLKVAYYQNFNVKTVKRSFLTSVLMEARRKSHSKSCHTFWTPGLPDGVHSDRPYPSVRQSIRL